MTDAEQAVRTALNVLRRDPWGVPSVEREFLAALHAAGFVVVPKVADDVIAMALMTPVAAALLNKAQPVIEIGKRAYREAMLAAARSQPV